MGVSPEGRRPNVWVYTDASKLVRVVEREDRDGHIEVIADGFDAIGGRHRFTNRADAARFRSLLERMLVAAGFAELWKSIDRLRLEADWR
jgi:hypothetical protein